MDFQLLEFDTKLFGFKVVKILSPRISLPKLQIILSELRTQNVRLVYWPSDSADKLSQQAARYYGGFLGSEHITYLLDLKKLSFPPLVASEIETYQAKIPNIELEQLAVYAGTYSHFNTDSRFPKELFFKLYRVWIENSVNGAVATKVLVIRHDDKIVGMIILGLKNMRGDIGLLGIDPAFRGKKYGTKLVHAAQAYFISEGLSFAQVVTQKANAPACRLYEKCGFYQEKLENFYHFWL